MRNMETVQLFTLIDKITIQKYDVSITKKRILFMWINVI